MLEEFQNFDYKLLEWIYSHRWKAADDFVIWTTQYATLVSVAVILFIFGLYFIKKEKKHLLFGIEISFVIVLTALINFAIKNIFQRLRPFDVHDNIKQLVAGGSYSFPSGHTMEVFALATAISILFKRPSLSALFFLWAIWIGYTRMAMGVHYPFDVFGGMILGISITFFILKWRRVKK